MRRIALLVCVRSLPVCFASLVPAQAAASHYAVPAFVDPQRRQHVEAVLPEIDQLFTALAEKQHLPGLVYGVVLDGQLLHARTLGLANVERKLPVARDTRFRIASMTKSFVAMAVLQLRDEGKLALDDPVQKHLPEFAAVRAPTADSGPITIANLMTMTTGLPEDNPWGDRQMAISGEALEQFVGSGLSFANPPGQTFEYSNLGYVLLGKVVSKVAGVRCQDHITARILRPLGMRDTVWEYADVPADKLANGYRWEDGAWLAEPILHDGDGAAMGGLITTIDDYARYIAFHLSAWPSRDDADPGPVRRATVREMHLPRVFSGASPKAVLLDGKTPNPSVSFYGYGLGWNRDSRGIVKVSHSGGLPGFGSIHRFCPDHGVGVIAFTNLRYGPVYDAANEALNRLLEHAPLAPRTVATSPILARRKDQVAAMIQAWDAKLVAEIAADNFLLDRSLADWTTLAKAQFAAIGAVTGIGEIVPENQLRGTFTIVGEKARMNVSFTLTPEAVPKVQELQLVVARPK
ncbi:MAG: beta-lactamase family protein [Planctomycetes bacterium]|nr:beta-lactamase family protein [Planctomycetota bacterium]